MLKTQSPLMCRNTIETVKVLSKTIKIDTKQQKSGWRFIRSIKLIQTYP